MVSRRRFVAGATLSALPLSGCLGGTAVPGRTADDPTTRSDESDGPDTAAVSQFQYDAANTGAVDSAAPASPDRQWRTRLDPAEGGLALTGDTLVVAAGSLVGVDVADGEVRWRTDVGHDVEAPPTTTADTAYVPTWNGAPGAERGVVAVDVSDGSERWRAVPSVDVTAPLTLADGVLYAGGALDSDEVIALDAADGGELWRFTAGEYASTAAVADGTAFVGGGESGTVYALDAESGDELWRFDATDEVWAAPTVRDGTVYVAVRDGRVSALDPANGDELWYVATGSTIRHSVGATDRAVYVSTEESLAALSTDGEELWSGALEYDGHAPTVTDDGVVCTDRERLYCFEAADGAERWRRDVREKPISDATYSGIRSPPLVADGTVYAVSFGGDVYALADDE